MNLRQRILEDIEAEKYVGYERVVDEDEADRNPDDPSRRYAEGYEAGVLACEGIIKDKMKPGADEFDELALKLWANVLVLVTKTVVVAFDRTMVLPGDPDDLQVTLKSQGFNAMLRQDRNNAWYVIVTEYTPTGGVCGNCGKAKSWHLGHGGLGMCGPNESTGGFIDKS